MNRTDMLALLERRLGSRQAADAALDAVLDEIQRAVAAGERVTLTGFGTFERVERPARTGRNPRTGAALQIAASVAPRFHAGASLRAAVSATTPPPDRADAPRAPRAVPAPIAVAESSKKAKKVKKAKKLKPAKKAKSPGKTAKSGKKT